MAKQLLNGQKIVVVRCEALNISGEFFRAKRTSQPFEYSRGLERSSVASARFYSDPFTDLLPVKYLAYLRKITRYNPTRGGTYSRDERSKQYTRYLT